MLARKDLLGKARVADDGVILCDEVGALPWGLLRRSPDSFESNGNSDLPGSTDSSPDRPVGQGGQGLGRDGAAPAAVQTTNNNDSLHSIALTTTASHDDDVDNAVVNMSSLSSTSTSSPTSLAAAAVAAASSPSPSPSPSPPPSPSPSSSMSQQLNSSLASIGSITTPLQQLTVLSHEVSVLRTQSARDSGATAELRLKLAAAAAAPGFSPSPGSTLTSDALRRPSSHTMNNVMNNNIPPARGAGSTSAGSPPSHRRGASRSSSGTPVDVVASRESELVAEVVEHVEKLANADVLNQVAILAAHDEVETSAEALRVALQQRDAQHDLLNVINEQWFTYGSSKAGTPGEHFKRVGEEIKLQNQLREHYHEALSVANSIASTESLERASRAAQLSDNLHKYDNEHEEGRMQLKDLRVFEANHKHTLAEQTRELQEAQQQAALLTAELEVSTSSEKNVKTAMAHLRRDITSGNKDLEELEAVQKSMEVQLEEQQLRLLVSNDERDQAVRDLREVQAAQSIAEDKLADAKQSVVALAGKHQTELDDARDQASEEEAAHARESEERTEELEEVKLAYSKTQTTLEKIELEMRQTQDKLQAELESLGVFDTHDSLDMASLLRELHSGVLRRKADLEMEIGSLERKLATHANASKSFASTIKMQQNRIAHLGEKLTRAGTQDDWENTEREMFGTGDADDISVILDVDDDDDGTLVESTSSALHSDQMSPPEKKEPEEAVVKRLEHAVAQLTADLGTVRRRLDEAKVAATRSLLRTWESNDDVRGCTRCGVLFSWREWRYHCRSCGRIFCSPCTSNRMRTTFHRLPQRSCQECFNNTLRLQKIRELQRQLAAARRGSLIPTGAGALTLEVIGNDGPPCYSSACRSGTGGTCYSPSCPYASRRIDPKEQRRVIFAKLALRIKEELLQRDIKMNSTVSDLYDLTSKFTVPSHRWSELCYFVLEGRHDSETMRNAYVDLKSCTSSAELDEVRQKLFDDPAITHLEGRDLLRSFFYVMLNNIVHAEQ